jgi:beta-N-acetylglucosaminidase
MAKSQQFDTWMARGRLNIKRSIALFLVAVLLSSACFTMALYAAPPEGEEINRIGYTNSANGSYLRSQPTTDSSRLSLLPRGTRVEVFVKVTGKEVNGVDTWYYVRAISLDLEGYVHSPLVTLTDTPIVAPPIIEDDHDFEYHLADQGFPESYKPALRALHETYPEWIFIAQHIIDFDTASTTRLPLTFDKAVYEEIKRKGTNLVGRNSLLSHRSYLPGDYNYKTDEWTIYDAGGWVGASREIVAYSIDARNFLNEQQIFQFELLSYNRQSHTIHAVEAAIVGTFMEGKSVTFTDHRDGTERTLTYPEIFIEAAEITNVSPFFLVQRCLMEVGRNGSGSVSGTVEGYEGYYNFYNIGATAGTNPVLNGLKYARYGSTGSGPTDTERERYWLPWNNQWRAIVGGAFWIGRGYINAGQDTQYSQKFNLDGDTYGTYWHQYMGNVYAPYYEAARVFEMYLNENLLHMPFVFKIPVLAELPEEKSPYPTSNKSLNNWLKSITVSTGTLTPEFDPEVYSYTVSVDESVNDITLTAESYHASCTINNTGNHTLTAGANTIVLEAVAERVKAEDKSNLQGTLLHSLVELATTDLIDRLQHADTPEKISEITALWRSDVESTDYIRKLYNTATSNPSLRWYALPSSSGSIGERLRFFASKALHALAEFSQEDGYSPRLLEWYFPHSDSEPYVLHVDTLRFTLRGLIDLIEENPAGKVRIIDFKRTSKVFSWLDLSDGTDIQLPLYKLAFETAFPEKKVDELYFCGFEELDTKVADVYDNAAVDKNEIRKKLESQKRRWEPGDVDGAAQFAEKKAMETIRHILTGAFPARPTIRHADFSPCHYCNWRAACGYDLRLARNAPLPRETNTDKKKEILMEITGETEI